MSEMQIGMVGLGVMGRNLSLNIEDKGFSVAGWDAWTEPVDRLIAEAGPARTGRIMGFKELSAFVASLRRPRRIIMLVKAGEVVDRTIAALRPLLERGDMLVDSGNEHYLDTQRRAGELAAAGIRFVGMGISGGEEGARHGPSLMPGGPRADYDELAPLLTRIAAQVEDGPCVTYCGPGGAGHYVKMVHNGIEYGDMQLIAEAYDLLRRVGGLTNPELAETFAAWNSGELQSYLIEISARIFAEKDPETGQDLIDVIVDAAEQKGTGKWAAREAVEIDVPVPTIAASVEARVLSRDRTGRLEAARRLPGPVPAPVPAARKGEIVEEVRAALYCAKAGAYAQGMNLLRAASAAHAWNLQLGELARIWKGGCIIRAQFLGRIQAAYARDPALANLLLDPGFVAELGPRQAGWRRLVGEAAARGVPIPAIAASLSYYDMARSARLPANLTQAQRDYFGGHGYARLDRPGAFHTQWS